MPDPTNDTEGRPYAVAEDVVCGTCRRNVWLCSAPDTDVDAPTDHYHHVGLIPNGSWHEVDPVTIDAAPPIAQGDGR